MQSINETDETYQESRKEKSRVPAAPTRNKVGSGPHPYRLLTLLYTRQTAVSVSRSSALRADTNRSPHGRIRRPAVRADKLGIGGGA